MKRSEQLKQQIAQIRQSIDEGHGQIGKWHAEARKLGGGYGPAMLREGWIAGLESTIKMWEAAIARMTESLRYAEIAEAAVEKMEAEEAQRQAEAERRAAKDREDSSREAAWEAWQINGGGTYVEFLEAWPKIRRTVATEAATQAAATAIVEQTGADPVVQAAQDALAAKYGGKLPIPKRVGPQHSKVIAGV